MSVNDIPLSVYDLTVAYDRRPVIWDIGFQIPPGSLVGIVGPNGAGKSTLLKAIMHLVPMTSGRIEIFGLPWNKNRHRVGYVPQRESVDWDFPISALDVVTMGLYREIGWCRPVNRRHRAAAMKALEQVGVADLAGRQISQLSGGQQQRLCIARTLATSPQIVLMDEPASALDPASTARIEDLIGELCANYTIVIVTHNMQQASRVSHQTAFFFEGRLIEVGPTTRIFTSPSQKKTEDYITGRFG